MHKEVNLYVNNCQSCLQRKVTPDVAPLQPIIANQPMELVHMDFLSIEPSKGNVENVLENFIKYYGFPKKFLSNQGRNFESELISELCKLAQVEKVHTTPYHPMTNGQCERFNSTLCNLLGTLPENEKAYH